MPISLDAETSNMRPATCPKAAVWWNPNINPCFGSRNVHTAFREERSLDWRGLTWGASGNSGLLQSRPQADVP